MPFGRLAGRYKKAPKPFVYGALALFLVNITAQLECISSKINAKNLAEEISKRRPGNFFNVFWVVLIVVLHEVVFCYSVFGVVN